MFRDGCKYSVDLSDLIWVPGRVRSQKSYKQATAGNPQPLAGCSYYRDASNIQGGFPDCSVLLVSYCLHFNLKHAINIL